MRYQKDFNEKMRQRKEVFTVRKRGREEVTPAKYASSSNDHQKHVGSKAPLGLKEGVFESRAKPTNSLSRA
jgi:hypothetical protein